MADTTRTSPESRHERLFYELTVVARAGLVPGALASKKAKLPEAFGLARVSSAGDDSTAQARSLIQLIIDSIRTLPGERLSAEADAHFGVQERYRDLPYETRRGMAVMIWDPLMLEPGAKRDASYTRREFRKMRSELATRMIALDHGSTLEQPSPTWSLSRVPAKYDRTTSGLRRVDCRLESWLTGRGQQQVRSEWTVRDEVMRSGITSNRSRRHARYAHHLEPLTPTVESVTFHGYDNYGYSVWQVHFREELIVGDFVTWGTATVYDEILPDKTEESDWASITSSRDPDAQPIEKATVIVHFDGRYLPSPIMKFITPVGTLPHPTGPMEDIKPISPNTARASFEDVPPAMTCGIFWRTHQEHF